ncbi:MAG: hypothetical protein ABMA02_16830 [Saprospiraceae bacterium]
MQHIEIQKGVQVGFDDFVRGATQMDTPDLEKLADQLNHILARRKTPHESEREVILVSKIYEALEFKDQGRYEALLAKLEDETISDAEYRELLALTQLAEAQNAVWLQAVADLAQIRNTTPRAVVKQLGLDKRFGK